MEPIDTLGLPSYVYQLLVSKSVEKDQILQWNVNGKNGVTELSLKWITRGSRWDTHNSEMNRKYKSPGHVRRDMNRKKIHNVKMNSKCVSTDNIICENMNMPSECDELEAAPISTSEKGERSSCLEVLKRHDYIEPQTTNMDSSTIGDDMTMMMDIENDSDEKTVYEMCMIDNETDNMKGETNTVNSDKVSSLISPEQVVQNVKCKQTHMESDYQSNTHSQAALMDDNESVLHISDVNGDKYCYNGEISNIDSLMEKYPLEKVVLNWQDGGIIMAKLGKLCLSFDPETKIDYVVKPYDEEYGMQRQMISRFKPITELQYVNIDGYEDYIKLLHRKGIEYMVNHRMIDK